MIVGRLNLQDLKNYSLACQAFDADATPFLWRSFVLKIGYDVAFCAANVPILRYPNRAQYVRTLTISAVGLESSFPGDLVAAVKESLALLRNVRDLRLLLQELRMGVAQDALDSSEVKKFPLAQLTEWMKNVALVSFTCDGIDPNNVLSLLRASPSLSNVTVNYSYCQTVKLSPNDISALTQAPLPYLSSLNIAADWVPILAGGRDLDTLSLSFCQSWWGCPSHLPHLPRKSCTVHTLDLTEIPSYSLFILLEYIRKHMDYSATTVRCTIDICDAMQSSCRKKIRDVTWLVQTHIPKPLTLLLRCVWPPERPPSWPLEDSIMDILYLYPPRSLPGVSLVVQFLVRMNEGTIFHEVLSITFEEGADGNWDIRRSSPSV